MSWGNWKQALNQFSVECSRQVLTRGNCFSHLYFHYSPILPFLPVVILQHCHISEAGTAQTEGDSARNDGALTLPWSVSVLL